jgi:ketosteroid isomerase-like protein
MGEAERERARRAVEAFNEADVEMLVEMTHPECVLRGLRYEVDGTEYRGRDAIRRFWADAAEIWEEMRMEDAEILDRDNRTLVTCRLVLRGRGSGAVVEHELAWLVEARDDLMYRGLTTFDIQGARRKFEDGG